MGSFQVFWNYTKKKNGDIVIAEAELQKMLDAAEKNGYNAGYLDGLNAVQKSMPGFHPGQFPARTQPGISEFQYQSTCSSENTCNNVTQPLTPEAKEQFVKEFNQNVNGQ